MVSAKEAKPGPVPQPQPLLTSIAAKVRPDVRIGVDREGLAVVGQGKSVARGEVLFSIRDHDQILPISLLQPPLAWSLSVRARATLVTLR